MMIESLTEEMMKSLEEIQEKTKINQSSKQTKKNRKKMEELNTSLSFSQERTIN